MTTLDAASTWAATLGQLELNVTRANYQTWLRDTVGLRFEGDRIVIGAPSDFATEWLQARMRPAVTRQLARQLGRSVEVSFEVIRTDVGDAPDALLAPAAAGDAAGTDAVPDFLRRQAAPPPALHPALTFQTFVIGEENRLAHDAARAMLAEPGAVSPLLIFGPSGLGKTHLLNAIGHAAHAQGLRVVFATGERFGNDYVRARNDGYEAFRAKYRQCDVLIVDDVQFFEGRERFQEELFHTFNELQSFGKQVVFSADRPPSLLTGLGEALRSRLGWGLAADLHKPQFETRLAILRAKSRAHARPLPDDALVGIAERCCPTVRELEGWLNRVIAFAPLVQADAPTRELVERALHPFADAPGPPEPPCTDAIVAAVCQRTGATPPELRSRSRNRQVTYARHLAMYIMKEDGEQTVADLARYFDRDHSSVISGIARIQKELPVIPETVADVRAVREGLSPVVEDVRRAG